ncbi:MAG: hypothetical protein ACRD7E_01200, partial [Bryobacteraceae bacterium]
RVSRARLILPTGKWITAQNISFMPNQDKQFRELMPKVSAEIGCHMPIRRVLRVAGSSGVQFFSRSVWCRHPVQFTRTTLAPSLRPSS